MTNRCIPLYESIPLFTHDKKQLSGVFTIPETPLRGVTLILSGSGPVGHSGDVSSPFIGYGYRGQSAHLNEQLSNQLASIGIASFRYSKRGFDRPEDFLTHTLSNLVQDACSGVQLLRNRFPEFTPSLVGFSEGALVALHVAQQISVESLHLLSLPTRSIDDHLHYQFIDWPMELLKQHLDFDQDGLVSLEDFMSADVTSFPSLPIRVSDFFQLQKSEQLSLVSQILPLYQHHFREILALVETPAFQPWYHSLKNGESPQTLAQKISSQLFVYQALRDSQVRPEWTLSDLKDWKKSPQVSLFPNLGHCFSPFEGSIQQIKTSGPFDSSLLKEILENFQT
jgi:pimeloyl-ACP methyl ester carboxylesterase